MKYSRADILGSQLSMLTSESTFNKMLNRLFLKSKKVRLVLHIPQLYVSRGMILCDDIERMSGEIIDIPFIIDVLCSDFVNELARSKSGPLAPFRYLMDRYSKTLQVAHYQSNKVDVFTEYRVEQTDLMPVKVFLPAKDILRLEWFLKDLEEEVMEHGFTVEKILEILYCNLIELVKKGEADKAIDIIIEMIERKQ